MVGFLVAGVDLFSAVRILLIVVVTVLLLVALMYCIRY